MGFLARGRMQGEYADGCTFDFAAPSPLVVEPGHDAWVVGDEAAVFIGVDFNLFVNDSRILDSVSRQGINIPANGSGDVHLRARVGYESIRSLFREVADLIQGNRARYEIRGNAYYDTPVGTLKFPVTVYSTSR